jgi:hypothetical protein
VDDGKGMTPEKKAQLDAPSKAGISTGTSSAVGAAIWTLTRAEKGSALWCWLVFLSKRLPLLSAA